MIRSTFLFLLGVVVCLMWGAKIPTPNVHDYIMQQVNLKLKHITDSVNVENARKDIIIKKNRDTIVPAIKAITERCDSLKKALNIEKGKVQFYREVTGQNPTLIHKRTLAKCK